MAWHIVSITKGEILLMAIAKQLAKCTQLIHNIFCLCYERECTEFPFHLYFFIPTCLLSEADRTKNIFKTRNIQ